MRSTSRVTTLVAVSAALLFSSASLVQAAPPDDLAVNASKQADNSKVNVRDRDHQQMLPTDQPNDAGDVKVAAAVRRSLSKDSTLSTMAHNIKLVASAGVVTLRGPVASESEKAKIEELTSRTPGVTSVQNDLDIKH